MAKARKRHLFRALLTDVEIEDVRPSVVRVIFHLADADHAFELPRGTAERLRDQLSDELGQV